MTKIDVFSGFLGAGKTTLIKKLIAEAYKGEKLVLIENEFGETGIDGGFMKESGIKVNELNSGCICCSLVGDFEKALGKVVDEYQPDRILIEPSGVGKLSDVIKAVLGAENGKAVLNAAAVVVDAGKCRMYIKNFGEFFLDQVGHAKVIILSRTKNIAEDKLKECIALLREHNKDAVLITTDWDELDGAQILAAMESAKTPEDELKALVEETAHHHHHHDDDDDDDDECDDPVCACHHHHDDDDDDEHEHHHHHHHDGDDECDDPDCECHHHHDDDDDDDDGHEHEHHHHHHHHHADEVFSSWGSETAHKYTFEELDAALGKLDGGDYGVVLRAKGIVPLTDGTWAHFDYVPGEKNLRRGTAELIGKLCVIGSHLAEDKLPALFSL